MKTSTQGNIQKNITLTPELFYIIMSKAREIGLDFQDYVRMILAASVKTDLSLIDPNKIQKQQNFELVDEETEKRIGQSLKDIAEGKYKKVNPQDEKALNEVLGI